MPNMMDALLGASQGGQLTTLSKIPPTLSIKDGVGVMSFEAITLSTFEAGKKAPGKFRWEGKNLRFEVTESSLAYIKRTWSNVIILRDAVKKAPPPPPAPLANELFWRPRLTPFDHQATAFALGAPKEAFAYLMDMGTGKTKVGIDDAAYHYARGEIDRVLVIAPNGVHEQWAEDALDTHWPLSLPIRVDAIITGKKKPAWWGKWDADPGECKWLCVNIENLDIIESKVGGRKVIDLSAYGEELEAFLQGGPSMIILDESHKIKKPSGNRALAVNKLGRSARFRRILTGTPIAKGLEDYYSQFRFLDPSIIGCWTFSGFKQQFCQMGGHMGKQIVGYRDTEEFHKRIANYSFRVEKSDVLDLPPKLYSERLVEMTAPQRRIYNELKLELMTQLSDGSIITAGEVVQRLLRLQQVTQGFLPLEDGSFEDIPTNRMSGLMELLDQAPDRVIIWCRFREDINRIIRELGDEAVRYDGEDKDKRPEVKRSWIAPGSKKRYFVGNAQAGGTGLDWINGSSTVIYYSNSYSSLDRWQSEDRTHRIGTRGTVNYYDMICKGTLDRSILANLKRKRDVSDMSLEELKQLLSAAW